MAKVSCGSLIRRAGPPNILGTAGCLVQRPEEPDRVLLLTAARVLVGRTPELFEAIEAVDLPGKPIGCLVAWSDLTLSDLKGFTTADVALVHVDPALVDAIGPSGAAQGINDTPARGDKLTIFSNGKVHNLTITDLPDQRTIDRVTPDSRESVNYIGQIICDPATEDSCVGAMAMDSSNKIVGMVAGGDGRAFTLVTPINALLSCTFGEQHVGGAELAVCTSVPATAKAPEKITHPNHISRAPPSGGTGSPLTESLIARIAQIAARSEIAQHEWMDRGRAPVGYIKGMALVFAQVYCNLQAGDLAATEMAKAKSTDSGHDVLALYDQKFDELGINNATTGADTLRHLFVLLIGLGMRESSGKYWEGRDQSASNTAAETAEAGLFQTSLDIMGASSSLLQTIFDKYRANPSGFIEVFKEGVSDKTTEIFGSGDGAEFQRLSKGCPAFAAEFAALGLRLNCRHWGPIRNQKAEVRQECDTMLQQVQAAVDRPAEV